MYAFTFYVIYCIRHSLSLTIFSLSFPRSLPLSPTFQPSDLVSMVYSCIGAEDEDSDSSFETRPVDRDTDRSTTSDIQTETHANGHAMSSASLTDRQPDRQPDRQTDPVSQDLPMPSTQTDTQKEVDRGTKGTESLDRQEGAPCGQKSEPPSQSSKPSLASMRQRHLQGSSGTAT